VCAKQTKTGHSTIGTSGLIVVPLRVPETQIEVKLSTPTVGAKVSNDSDYVHVVPYVHFFNVYDSYYSTRR
jgi:hypothetical protein